MILDDKWVNRNTIVDDKLVPEKLRAELLDYEDLSECGGEVMLLNGLACIDKKGFWMTLSPGATIRWEDIPPRTREGLKEGVHYVKNWTQKEHRRLLEEAEQRELKMLQPEPLNYEDAMTGWKIQ